MNKHIPHQPTQTISRYLIVILTLLIHQYPALAAIQPPEPSEALENIQQKANATTEAVKQDTQTIKNTVKNPVKQTTTPLGKAYQAHQNQIIKDKIEKDTLDRLIVNINTADLAELTLLEGIGLSRAQAIIDYRSQNGAFKSLNDLTRVKGIGLRLIEKNRERIALD